MLGYTIVTSYLKVDKMKFSFIFRSVICGIPLIELERAEEMNLGVCVYIY